MIKCLNLNQDDFLFQSINLILILQCAARGKYHTETLPMSTHNTFRPQDRRVSDESKHNILSSQPKHMLWVNSKDQMHIFVEK